MKALIFEFAFGVLGLAFLSVMVGVWIALWCMNWFHQRLPDLLALARPLTVMQCPECDGNGIWLVMDDTEFACRLCDGQRFVTVPGMAPPNPLVRNGAQR